MTYKAGEVLYWGAMKVIVVEKVLSSAYRVQFLESGSWKLGVVEGRHLTRNRPKPKRHRTAQLIRLIGTG